ncbi:NAD-dependent epimerase/dehydratase family protein [Polycladidibacter stylochi]|uniref:NAD-dependent epimerase/dehydratase family protein n=1 Tax=Polycladidibacter stylochi TaxID=1807766 RepID=UPI000834E3D6|nr:NAD-dependent epimerase/dehydratase family protein [Pseudovibrio stylochi]
MTVKTALVLGASGLIGTALLQELLVCNRYETVIALVRQKLPLINDRLLQFQVDFNHIPALEPLMRAEHVYCALGTTRKTAGSNENFYTIDFTLIFELAQLARKQGVQHFLLVSSIGANPDSKNIYLKTKGELEQEILKLGFPALSIFRPSLLLGPRKEFRSVESLAKTIGYIVSPLLVGPLKPYRPIKAQQVATAMLQSAKKHRKGNRLYMNEEIRQLSQTQKGSP